uniref:Probable ATP-dependent transporter ycf16 n=1 Tax=Gronococcus sybilensis TaxID=3028029 RepID=A0A9Y1MXP2_9RHOD|nr:sulfate ABC transporter protein [Gronococcus sybilensis]
MVLDEISKFYSNRVIVNTISLSIKQGEIVGLLGPNGAGKTTIFSLLTGLDKPDHGRVWVNSIDISNTSVCSRARLGIGYLPQESSIFNDLSINENLQLVLEEKNLHKTQVQKVTRILLKEFQLTHLQDKCCRYISGGERRRVEIARSLSSRPKFLLLDEPFAGVDPLAIEDIQTLLKKLKKWNLGILITDHNVRDTLHITDRTYIIHSGNFLAQGTPSEISASQLAKDYYLGENFYL